MFRRRRKLVEKIETLEHELKDLKEIVKTQELIQLRSQNAVLKEKERMISNVHLHVKSHTFDPDNNKFIVRYEVEPIVLSFDSDGKVVKNEMFYAINALRLIPLKEMGPLHDNLEKAKEAQKK